MRQQKYFYFLIQISVKNYVVGLVTDRYISWPEESTDNIRPACIFVPPQINCNTFLNLKSYSISNTLQYVHFINRPTFLSSYYCFCLHAL